MCINYQAGLYNDPETGRTRWGVCCSKTHVWYFATRYGEAPARALATRMNSTTQH
jgi:hypothetical protein